MQSDFMSLYELAHQHAKSGRFKEAGQLYIDLLHQNPTNVEVIHDLVFCLDKLGQTEDAEKFLRSLGPVVHKTESLWQQLDYLAQINLPKVAVPRVL